MHIYMEPFLLDLQLHMKDIANPTLTDAPTFMYYCLPNHRYALAKGVGGDPPFQGDSGLKLE